MAAKSVSALVTSMISVGQLIKADRNADWIEEWNGSAKKNKHGVEMRKTFKKGLQRSIFQVEHKGMEFEIYLEDWDDWGFEGKRLTQLIFDTRV